MNDPQIIRQIENRYQDHDRQEKEETKKKKEEERKKERKR